MLMWISILVMYLYVSDLWYTWKKKLQTNYNNHYLDEKWVIFRYGHVSYGVIDVYIIHENQKYFCFTNEISWK